MSAVLALVGALGWYGYEKYQERIESKKAAAHQKLVDACVNRFPDPDKALGRHRADWFDIIAACDKNPDLQPPPTGSRVTAWDEYGNGVSYTLDSGAANPDVPSLIEIHGGETLKIVAPATANGFTDIVPLLYLGHGQKFVFACGNYGEHQTPQEFPTFDHHHASCK